MENVLLVFDKDGVLLDSEGIKLNTLEGLFSAYPQHSEAIHTYNCENIGIPRAEKLHYISSCILEMPNPKQAAKIFGKQYTRIVNNRLMEAKLIDGVREYLELKHNYRKFVCSAAPEPEVQMNLQREGLLSYFEKIYAYPSPKPEVLTALKETLQQEVVFFGDTKADYQAAQEAGVHFIGVTSAKEMPFKDLGIPLIPDFTDHEQVDQIINDLIA